MSRAARRHLSPPPRGHDVTLHVKLNFDSVVTWQVGRVGVTREMLAAAEGELEAAPARERPGGGLYQDSAQLAERERALVAAAA
eukprot:105583-Pyramimonas_sp.AAC.1